MRWPEHAVRFERCKAGLFLQNYNNVSLLVEGRSCESSNLFLRNVLLNFAFNHDLLLVPLRNIFALICRLEEPLSRLASKWSKRLNSKAGLTIRSHSLTTFEERIDAVFRTEI